MSRVSILWVTQEPTVLQQGIALCARLNYSLLQARDETTGWRLAQQHTPKIIVCELSPSAINGYNFLEKIRQNQDTAIIPVIFLSNCLDTSQHRKAMEMGADDILFAPYCEPDLENAIAARLTRQQTMIRRSQQELEQLRYNITAFLPHEFKTALTGIIAGTDLLLNRSIPLESSVMRELLYCIQSSGKRLSRLSNNFLLYCELKAVSYDPVKVQNLRNQKTHFAYNNISQTSIKQTHRYHRQQDLILDLQEASVKMDKLYLMKLVEELIDNACKFSPPGTPIKVRSQVQKDYLSISISDRGRGMTPQQIEQIGLGIQFDRSLYEQQGFGLGLAIAKNLIQLHGGKLKITSIPQKTTKVSLTLPLAKSSARQKFSIVSSRC
ncbi:MAG: ATP-binding protein [Xenococcaceae cyanobacterium MO_207.B15]|nr:ATP-binding protein [Xenococcaceae cyanobacterium MO_207.B15]